MTTVNPIQQHAVQHNNVDFETYKLTHATSPNTTITVYTYGGHITQWSVLGNEILYMSNKAVFQAGKGIRGGMYIVYTSRCTKLTMLSIYTKMIIYVI